MHVEDPDACRDELYANSQSNISDNQNIAIALSCLNAPAGADMFKHGRFVVYSLHKTQSDVDAKR